MARYIDIEPYEGCKIVANNEDKGVLVKDIPTADVQEVKHGKWIKNDSHGARETWVSCNLCSHTTTILFAFSKDYNFCPNCGAKMDKE